MINLPNNQNNNSNNDLIMEGNNSNSESKSSPSSSPPVPSISLIKSFNRSSSANSGVSSSGGAIQTTSFKRKLDEMTDEDEDDEDDQIMEIRDHHVLHQLHRHHKKSNSNTSEPEEITSSSIKSSPAKSALPLSHSQSGAPQPLSLLSVLETIMSSHHVYYFPKDQFLNYICIYNGCTKMVRSKSLEDYLVHLKIHDLKAHSINESLMKKGTGEYSTSAESEDDMAIYSEEAVAFTKEALKKYEAMFGYYENLTNYSNLLLDQHLSPSPGGKSKASQQSFDFKKLRPDISLGKGDEEEDSNTFDLLARVIENMSKKDQHQQLQLFLQNSNLRNLQSNSSILNSNNNNNHSNNPNPINLNSSISTTKKLIEQQKAQALQNPNAPLTFNSSNKYQQLMLFNDSPSYMSQPSQGMIDESERYAIPARYSSRGIHLREQMMKYGLQLFRMDSEGKYICFFQGCNLHMITNFSRHVAKHEKVGDVIKPELFHLSNFYNPQNPQTPQQQAAAQQATQQNTNLLQQQQQLKNFKQSQKMTLLNLQQNQQPQHINFNSSSSRLDISSGGAGVPSGAGNINIINLNSKKLSTTNINSSPSSIYSTSPTLVVSPPGKDGMGSDFDHLENQSDSKSSPPLSPLSSGNSINLKFTPQSSSSLPSQPTSSSNIFILSQNNPSNTQQASSLFRAGSIAESGGSNKLPFSSASSSTSPPFQPPSQLSPQSNNLPTLISTPYSNSSPIQIHSLPHSSTSSTSSLSTSTSTTTPFSQSSSSNLVDSEINWVFKKVPNFK